MQLVNPRHILLYLVLLLGGLLSLDSAPSVPQQLDISFNHDLIYLDLGKGSVMRWSAGEAQPEVLAGPSEESPVQTTGKVVALSASDSGQELALTIALDEQGYELVWLLPASLEILAVETFALQPEVKLSPNGQWVAYREEESTEIFAVRMDEPSEKIIVGTCEDVVTDLRGVVCGSFQWSPNSAQLAWSDGRGLWIAQPPVYEKKVLNNFILYSDEEGDYIGGYGIVNWSPTSRYLVLRRSRWIEGSFFVLLDAYQGNLVEIPNTYVHVGPSAKITWLDQAQFSVLKADLSFTRGPFVEIWKIDSTSSTLLLSQSRFLLSLPCAFVNQTGLYDKGIVFYILRQINQERENCDLQSSDGLYFAASPGSYLSHAVEYITRSDNVQVSWSPDLQFAVLYLDDSQTEGSYFVEFLNLKGEFVEDLTPIIGNAEDACCFTWVE